MRVTASCFSHQNTIFGYLSCIFSLFFSRNTRISSVLIGSRTYVRDLERRALITVKLGFSVVAPMRVIIHFSTHGRSTSCCDLLHLWISSRKRIVCRHSWKFLCAFVIILTTSSFLERTPERWKNSASRELDITRARLVFPHPGGHQKIIEGIFHASIKRRIDFHGPIRWLCPTRSSIDSGRRREASGVRFFEKSDSIQRLYYFHEKCKKDLQNTEFWYIDNHILYLFK